VTEQGAHRHVVLRGRFDTARILPGLPAVHVTPVRDPRMRGSAASAIPIGTAVIDLVPAVLFSFASNPVTYRRVESLYQRDAQRFGLLASKSPLVGHPVFGKLTGIAAATARHLLGLLVYESVDPAFASSVDRLVEHSWHRAWAWVANHEDVNVGDFIAASRIPPRTRDELDAECVVLVWQAGRVGRKVVPSPELQSLRESLLSWSVLMALESMRPASRPPVPQRDASSYFGDVWSRVVGEGSAGDLTRVVARVMELANTQLRDPVVSPASADADLVHSVCDTLARVAPRSGDEEAATALAWLIAVAQTSRAAHTGDRTEELQIQVRRLQEDLKAEEHRSVQLGASLAVLERMARQTTVQLENERARVKRRDAEIMGLREQADVATHNHVSLEKKAVEPIEERLLVAGGSQALARRLKQWMPNVSCVTEDQESLFDTSTLHGCAAAVILTSHISHALADTVTAEARRQGVPVILIGWSNTSRIVRAVREALNRRV
jgi:hypothetical protein